jgi:hypothetical protein
MLTRRALFAAALLATHPARAADTGADEQTILEGVGVPASRARVLAHGLLDGTPTITIAFGADVAEGRRDLFAVIAAGRVAALEILSWQGYDGARLYTRVSGVPNDYRLRLERNASSPRGHGYRHEAWTDYLAWHAATPMTDAPVRPVLAETWQASLASQRRAMPALLAPNLRAIPPALLAACPPPRLG